MASILFFLAVALGVSFLCSILEASLLSTTKSFISDAVERKRPFAKRLARLKADIDRPLAAILSLNTIAHTVGAAGVGAEATVYFGEAYFGIISVVLTLLILFLSEIIPKTLGAVHWRKLAGFTTYACEVTIYAMYPLVFISMRAMTRFQGTHVVENKSRRSEVLALAKAGEIEGALEPQETRVIHNLFRLRQLKAENVMTPRSVVVALDESSTCADAMRNEAIRGFSRLPVWASSIDAITGYVLKRDILEEMVAGRHTTPLIDLKRKIAIVVEFTPLAQLFDGLVLEREPIVAVVNEFGETAGIVTQEDLIETLLGVEIIDEGDTHVDMQKLAREQWAERAKGMGIDVDQVS